MNKGLERNILAFIIITASIISGAVIIYDSIKEKLKTSTYQEVENPVDSLSFLYKTPEEGLWEAMEFYDIQFKDIVYAQAILESRLGTSSLYLRTNNLFGLYDNRYKRYYYFDHWSESVKAYKDMIQYKYKPPEDYYAFLERIGYAEDQEYTNKLKQIIKTYDKVK